MVLIKNAAQSHNITDIIFLDACPQTEYCTELLKNYNLYIYDHHVPKMTTATTINEKNEKFHLIKYDKKYSGCGIIWQELYQDIDVPKVVQYINNADVLNFSDTNTRLFTTMLKMLIVMNLHLMP
jgi:hypothetical protein